MGKNRQGEMKIFPMEMEKRVLSLGIICKVNSLL